MPDFSETKNLEVIEVLCLVLPDGSTYWRYSKRPVYKRADN